MSDDNTSVMGHRPNVKKLVSVVADSTELESAKDLIFEPLEPGWVLDDLKLNLVNLDKLEDEHESWEEMKEEVEEAGGGIFSWEYLQIKGNPRVFPMMPRISQAIGQGKICFLGWDAGAGRSLWPLVVLGEYEDRIRNSVSRRWGGRVVWGRSTVKDEWN